MKYFIDVYYLMQVGKGVYEVLSPIVEDSPLSEFMVEIEGYIKNCIRVFCDGDIEEFFEEGYSLDKWGVEELYKRALVEVDDEEFSKRVLNWFNKADYIHCEFFTEEFLDKYFYGEIDKIMDRYTCDFEDASIIIRKE